MTSLRSNFGNRAPTLQRPHRAARKFLLQIEVALFASNETPQHALDAAMTAGKFDHSFGERCAPEIAVKALAHLGSSLQLAAEIFAPTFFIFQGNDHEIGVSK